MRRHLMAAIVVAFALAILVTAALRFLRSDQGKLVAALTGAAPVSSADPHARFAVLSKRHTNQCGFEAQSLESLARGGRLQGACCSAMDYEHYAEQLSGLKSYRAIAQVPRDPYDIPVALAEQLIAYDDSLELTASQQSVYGEAGGLATEHGPCCCHCWRWSAFEGQAKYLIGRRGYTARQIAQVWDLEDGCGGPSEQE